MKYLLVLWAVIPFVAGCGDAGNGTVDNTPTRSHNIGTTSDQARSYAAGQGNLSSSIPYTPPSRR